MCASEFNAMFLFITCILNGGHKLARFNLVIIVVIAICR